MRELHLFAGSGGGILGGIILGHTTVCAVEIERYCRQVLLQRQRDGILPKFPIWYDVRTFDGNPWRGLVDIVCGGFPCQDISAAGKGKGITGERSGLWKEMARIIGEIRPKFAFMENSPLLRSRGLNVVLKDLAEMGYDARWGIVGAHNAGAFHKRERLWILAYTPSPRPQGIHPEQRLSCKKSIEEGLHCQLSGFSGNANGQRWILGEISSGNFGNADGVAARVDRLKAIGNGQVPIVAATAFRILSKGLISP